MLPDLEHQGFLKKMEKQVNNKQKLVPVFFKNPFKPAAKLMYGSKRYTNAIKFNSCQKYDEIIEKHINRQSKIHRKLIDEEIQNPRADILRNILKNLETTTFRDYDTILQTELPQERRLKKIILKEEPQTRIEFRRTPFKLPKLSKSVDITKTFQDSKISDIISTCHYEKDNLTTIDSIILNNHKKQRRHLLALKKNVNILSLDF